MEKTVVLSVIFLEDFMKNNLNKICTLLLFFALVPCMFASGKKDKELKVAFKKGVNAVPFAYLCENKPKLGKDIQLALSACDEYEQVLTEVLGENGQLGILPVEAAAKAFNRSKGALIALGVSGTGNIYLLSKNAGLSGLSQLKGKTLFAFQEGSANDYVMLYLLKKAGLSVGKGEDSVSLDYSIPPAKMTAALNEGHADYAVMPEPYASVAEIKGQGIVRNIDFQKEYAGAETGDTFPVFLLVANAEYVKENQDYVKAFADAYKKAVAWTNAKAARAGVLVQKHELGMMAPVVTKSIPYASYTWIPAAEARKAVEKVLKICLDANPESAGGKLPEESFYYVF